MGYFSACDVRLYLPEDQALAWHLQYNYFPPISLIFLPVIREALTAARRGHFLRHMQLPTGRVLTVAQIIEDVHLQAFLDEKEDA